MKLKYAAFGIMSVCCLNLTQAFSLEATTDSLEIFQEELAGIEGHWFTKFTCNQHIKSQISQIEKGGLASNVLDNGRTKNKKCLDFLRTQTIKKLSAKIGLLTALAQELEARNENTDLIQKSIVELQVKLENF